MGASYQADPLLRHPAVAIPCWLRYGVDRPEEEHMADAWSPLIEHMKRIDTLSNINAVLHWDQQTGMPPAAGKARGEQSAALAGLVHDLQVDPRLSEWLGAVDPAGDEVKRAALRNLGRTIQRANRVPKELVERRARLESEGFSAWMEARHERDFARFAPVLQELLDATIERAQAIDDSRAPYDVLLEDFDPGTTTADLDPMFARLRDGLHQLVDAVRDLPAPAPVRDVVRDDVQLAWHRDLLETLGYDFSSGAMAKSAHPFTIRLGPRDVRITTRILEDDVLSGLGGTVHEGGHAMYEQGLPDLPGTGVGAAASMGMHESQSRFWENFIGRSRPFFGWAVKRLQACGGPGLDADRLYRSANRIQPDLIRVEADEVTYNLHIIVRYELEQALFRGDLAVADLPDAWNERYRTLLGVEVPDVCRGVLQDVHWASAAFGYFPSYTLGNLYAASFGVAIEEAVPDLWADVAEGRFERVLAWLREQIHAQGHKHDSPELMQRVVGDRDHVEDLLAYLWGRHGALYGVKR